jgi:hypothetical protein
MDIFLGSRGWSFDSGLTVHSFIYVYLHCHQDRRLGLEKFEHTNAVWDLAFWKIPRQNCSYSPLLVLLLGWQREELQTASLPHYRFPNRSELHLSLQMCLKLKNENKGNFQTLS